MSSCEFSESVWDLLLIQYPQLIERLLQAPCINEIFINNLIVCIPVETNSGPHDAGIHSDELSDDGKYFKLTLFHGVW